MSAVCQYRGMLRLPLCTLLLTFASLVPCVASAAVPERAWGTYVGAAGDDIVVALAVDAEGMLYACGTTRSTTGISTPGSFQPTTPGDQKDVFLLKFTPGGARVWGTYLGGKSEDNCHGVAVDGAGNVAVVGNTLSSDFDTTPDTVMPVYGGIGEFDGFVVLFDTDGQRLWGTYIGGVLGDSLDGVAFDEMGAPHVAGISSGELSFDLPGAHQPAPAGLQDSLLIKLDADGGLVWGTYHGGVSSDIATSIAVGADAIYIGGYTGSSEGIATPGAWQAMKAGSLDNFVARFAADGSLVWATYYGGEGIESDGELAIAGGGDVVWASYTTSTTGIATPGAHKNFLGGSRDVVLARFDGGGDLTWATYVGSSGDDQRGSVAVDPYGNLLLVGLTNSTSFIATQDAYQGALAGEYDLFLAKFDPAGARVWSTYYGGPAYENNDNGNLAVHGPDAVYIAGKTKSLTGVATPDAFQPVAGAKEDGFVVRFDQANLGGVCQDDADCAIGFCADGVCCDDPCGGADPGDCQTCSAALGAVVDGTCTLLAADTTCRPAAAECDAPELCSGDEAACPADAPVSDDTPCSDGLCLGGVCEPAMTTSGSDTSSGSGDTSAGSSDTSTGSADPSTGSSEAGGDSQVPTGGSSDGSSSDADGVPTGTGPDVPGSTGAADPSGDASTGQGTAGQTDGGCGCATGHAPMDMCLVTLSVLALGRRRRRGLDVQR
jgi:hypothetical protein